MPVTSTRCSVNVHSLQRHAFANAFFCANPNLRAYHLAEGSSGTAFGYSLVRTTGNPNTKEAARRSSCRMAIVSGREAR